MNEEYSLAYNLFLIGFMGSGKSSVAAYLHRKYEMPLFEMDETIAEREGMSIPELFETKGEEYFRAAETAFRDLLHLAALLPSVDRHCITCVAQDIRGMMI